ncbi:MAG: phage portal protein [Hirschia sp.]|nr:phage portal protein [Hirschia sp.]MBF19342.1 phage portal protein [Hirschia sp.]
MFPFTRREAKASASVPLIALSQLGAAHWTQRDPVALAREGFERNAVGYRCIRMIAEAAASVALVSPDADGPVADLIARPNPEQSGPELLEAFYGHLQTAGNAFLYGVTLEDGAVREIHVLRPDRMRVLKGRSGWPMGWVMGEGRDERRFLREADGWSPVMQMKLFHPTDDVMGFSPLAAASRAVDVHNAGAAWAKALIDNSARPSGALVYGAKDGARMTEEQFAGLKRELEEAHSGVANAGKPMVLEGGLDWKPMGLTPADMDFIAARHAAAREIALAFGVPPMMLGIPGDNTYSNYKEANLAFWRLSVLPLVEKAARAISAWLSQRADAPVMLRPDLDRVPALSAERDALWARLEGASFATVEEKRALAGLES